MPLQISLKSAFGQAATNFPFFKPAEPLTQNAEAASALVQKTLSDDAFIAHVRDVLSRPDDPAEHPIQAVRSSLHGGLSAGQRMQAAGIVLAHTDAELTARPGAWAQLAMALLDAGAIMPDALPDKIAHVLDRAVETENLNGLFECLRLGLRLAPEKIMERKDALNAAVLRTYTAPSSDEDAVQLAISRIDKICLYNNSIGRVLSGTVDKLIESGVAAAIRLGDFEGLRDVLSADFEKTAGRNLSRINSGLQCDSLSFLLDRMTNITPSETYEYLSWYRVLATDMTPQPAAAAMLLDEKYDTVLRRVFPEVLREALKPGDLDVKGTNLRQIMTYAQPDARLLNEMTLGIIDDYIAAGEAAHALRIAADTRLLELRGGEPVLTTGQAEKMAHDFMAHGAHGPAQLLSGLLENHPDAAARALRDEINGALAEKAGMSPAAHIVHQLAPILSGGADETARAFAAFVHAIPLSDAATAQADMLAPVWDAFERAIPHAKPLGEFRPDNAPATAAEMHDLSLSVAAYMGVVQTQLPVILPTGASGASILNRMVEAAQPNGSDLSFADFSVRGSGIHSMANEDGEWTHDVGFSFLTAQRAHTDVVEGQRVTKRTLLSLPVISLDAGILADTLAHGGEGVVRATQEIAGIFNHDYFHHFTAAIINPYYSTYNGGLDSGKIPYGLVQQKIEEQAENDKRPFNNVSAAPRSSREYLYGRWNNYGQNEKEWPVFGSPHANYEGHAMHMHNVLYRRYLDDTPVGVALRRHIDDCADGVAALGARMAAAGKSPEAVAEMKFYYASYLTFNLRRLVPLDHPVMQHADAAIARMDIDRKECRAIVRRLATAMDLRDLDKRHANVAEMSGVNPRDPDIDPVAAARWNGIRMSVNVLNMLYMDKYADAQAKSIPALREALSVIRTDLSFMDKAGGLALADSALAAQHAVEHARHKDRVVRIPRAEDGRDHGARMAVTF